MDRTRTAWGASGPWTVAGAPILMVAVYMIFMARLRRGRLPISSSGGLFWASEVPSSHSRRAAWGANLASGYDERSRLYGIVGGMSGVGAIAFLLLEVIFATPRPGLPNNVQLSGWIVIFAVPIAAALLAVLVREPVSPTVRTAISRHEFRELVLRPEMVRLILADFALALGPGTTTPLYLFFFRDVLGFNAAQEGELLIIYVGAAFLGGPALGWAATRLNKHRTLMLSTVGYAVCQTSLFVIPKGMFWAAAPGMFGCGFIAAGFTLLVRAMVADVGDEVRLEQGKERMSLLYSLVTTTTKVGGAITLPVTYGVLALVGYRTAPGAVNTAVAIHGLTICYVLAPIVFVLVGGLCLTGYRLDARRHGEIRARLDLRDAAMAGVALVDPLAHAEPADLAATPTAPRAAAPFGPRF